MRRPNKLGLLFAAIPILMTIVCRVAETLGVNAYIGLIPIFIGGLYVPMGAAIAGKDLGGCAQNDAGCVVEVNVAIVIGYVFLFVVYYLIGRAISKVRARRKAA